MLRLNYYSIRYTTNIVPTSTLARLAEPLRMRLEQVRRLDNFFYRYDGRLVYSIFQVEDNLLSTLSAPRSIYDDAGTQETAKASPERRAKCHLQPQQGVENCWILAMQHQYSRRSIRRESCSGSSRATVCCN